MKKFLSITLAVSMLATAAAALVGCGGGTLYQTADIDWDVDLSKPIELTGLFPDSGMKTFGNDDTSRIIEAKTGYKVKYEELTGASVEGEISNALMNQEPYDFMKLNDGCYTPYLEADGYEGGSFLDLTELLENTPEGKVLYQLVDLMDYGWESVKYTDSKGVQHIYAIPDFGYVNMTGSALVWNVKHLEKIGFSKQYNHDIPETLGEFTWAVEELQKTFGSKKSYNAFGVPGAASAEIDPITGCFEVPYNFYVDGDGKIQIKNYSPNMQDYILYMNKLYNDHVLADNWNTSSSNTVAQMFAEENHSVAYVTYWNLTPFIDTIVGNKNFASNNGYANTVQEIHDKAIKWGTRLRGDGYTFNDPQGNPVSCKNQTKSKLPGSSGGSSYFTVIPNYMAKNARYVIDYLAKKMECFADFFGGNGLLLADQEQYGNDPAKFPTETHWYEIPTPTGAPAAADYKSDKATDDKYTAYEDFEEGICFVRPMHYEYVDTRTKDVGGFSEDGSPVTVVVDEPGRWIKITERYVDYIADNSQYCTGTNAIAAKVYCHLHELGFKAWYYCDYFADPEEWIPNPLAMAPPFKLWSPVNITSRSYLLTGVETSIKSSDPLKDYQIYLDGALATSVKISGTKYYYWSDAISEEMTNWYNSYIQSQTQKNG